LIGPSFDNFDLAAIRSPIAKHDFVLSRVDDFFTRLQAVKVFAAQLAFSVSNDFAVRCVKSPYGFGFILTAPWTGWMRVESFNGHSLLFCALDTPQEKLSQGLSV
jgi:hypothetical protein